VWLGEIGRALASGEASEVPCGACTACCSAAQFVHVGPDEVASLASIPEELLFPAPGLPYGHQLLGYDEQGRCPPLGDAGCTIYQTRPRACRVYDCRVFTATGVLPDEPPKAKIAQRARSWRFAVTTPAERAQWAALHRAADFVAALPEAAAAGPTAQALAALKVHGLFLGDDGPRVPDRAEVLAALAGLGS
jgi:hypothetical protein